METTDLATRLRQRADDVAPFSPAAATAFREAADEVEAWIEGHHLEALDLGIASYESGYTQRHLRRLIREGRLANVGTDDEPRVLRAHLPRKPGWGLAKNRPKTTSSVTQTARAIAAGRN